IKLSMNYDKTYWVPGISVEDAGRVEDPTLFVRPCKDPAGVRSLVLTESDEKCLEEELLYYQSVLPKSDVLLIPPTG
ncbi:MAG: hypothetical protein IJK68_02200, partial [Muribaculaceae bacterium]|nr:hypothetical protein [Muribaculaceae bacterium]